MKTQVNTKVVYLTNQLLPTQVQLWELVGGGVGDLTIFVSTLREPNRRWPTAVGTLKVLLQKSITVASRWKNPMGCSDENYVHFPIDTYLRLRSAHPDVVISAQLGCRSLMAAAFRLIHSNTRLILFLQMSEHQQRGAGGVRRFVRRMILRHADWAVVNSQSAQRVLTALGFPKHRTTVCFTSCPQEQFFASSPPSGWKETRRLVFLGRLVNGKGLLPMLQALDQVIASHPDLCVEMNFVGYGPLSKEIPEQTVCERLKVLVRGPVEESTRHETFRLGQVFVFPSLSDEWGIVVNEAMAAGLPVCGSIYSQAVVELVEPGVTGWTFDPLDRASTVQALETMLLTPEDEVRKMGRAARERVADITPERAAAKILLSIESVH